MLLHSKIPIIPQNDKTPLKIISWSERFWKFRQNCGNVAICMKLCDKVPMFKNFKKYFKVFVSLQILFHSRISWKIFHHQNWGNVLFSTNKTNDNTTTPFYTSNMLPLSCCYCFCCFCYCYYFYYCFVYLLACLVAMTGAALLRFVQQQQLRQRKQFVSSSWDDVAIAANVISKMCEVRFFAFSKRTTTRVRRMKEIKK